MTDPQHRPGARPATVLEIALTDADGRAVIRPPAPARPVAQFRPAPPPARPTEPEAVPDPPPARPAAPAPAVPVFAPPVREDETGHWIRTRPVAPARPPARTRAPAQTGRGPLVAVAVAIPAAGTAGILAGVIDTLSNALAAVIPIAALVGAGAAWLFLSRVGSWVRERLAALAGRWRR